MKRGREEGGKKRTDCGEISIFVQNKKKSKDILEGSKENERKV